MKPVNPYSRLKKKFVDYINKVHDRKQVYAFYYTNPLDSTLFALKNYTETADKLGYETHLRVVDNDLRVYYVAKLPERPWDVY